MSKTKDVDFWCDNIESDKMWIFKMNAYILFIIISITFQRSICVTSGLQIVWSPDVEWEWGLEIWEKCWNRFSVKSKIPQPLHRQWRGWRPRCRFPGPRGSVSWLSCCCAPPPSGPPCGWLHGPEGEKKYFKLEMREVWALRLKHGHCGH